MKTFRLNLLSLLALMLLFSSTSLIAQQETKEKKGKTIIIIKKGNSDVEKTVESINDLEEILHEFHIDKEDAEHHFLRAKSWHHDSKKAFLGVVSEKNELGNGIVLESIVSNSSAAKAGFKAGDIITSIDGNAINSVSDLRRELAKHQAGDAINVAYIRDGQASQVGLELGAKKSRAYSYTYRTRYERDPCAVFIGVYTGTAHGKSGVRVHGVIDDTPTMEANIQKGDIITALDGIAVRTHNELLVERNKHNPGDEFVLSYIRNGVAQEVTAYFKSCDEPTTEVQEEPVQVVEEKVEPEIIEKPSPAITQPVNNTLELEGMEAYPNPTYGEVNLKFKAAAKPISVKIIDIQGRVIFNDEVNNFDGFYNRTLDVSNGTSGVLSINITQEGKVFSKNIVLLPRA